MVDNKEILAGIEVIKEFDRKFAALCDEYKNKMREVCPGDRRSKYFNYKRNIGDLFFVLHFIGKQGRATIKELEDSGFEFDFINDENTTAYYKKMIDGVEVSYSVDVEPEDGAI